MEASGVGSWWLGLGPAIPAVVTVKGVKASKGGSLSSKREGLNDGTLVRACIEQ